MDIFQYRKFFIYGLTFLAYAWSGYGSGLLGNLRDAVLSTESIFTDLYQNALTIVRKLKNIHEIFDTAVEEHCNFKCPSG
jgi:secretory phospholipase A2